MTTAVLDRLAARQAEDAQAKEADYRALAAQIAGGTLPDAAEASATCREAGKTPEDLQRDVDRLVRRKELRAQIAAFDAAHAAVAAAEANRQQAEQRIAAEHIKFLRLCDELRAPLLRQRDEHERLRQAADRAKVELMRHPPPVIAEAQRNAGKRMIALQNRTQTLVEARVNAEGEAQAIRQRVRRSMLSEADAARYQREAELADDRARQHLETLAEVDREIQELKAERAALEARCLTED